MPDVKADSLERRKPRVVTATSPQFSNSTYAFPRHVRAPVFNASDARTRKTRSCGPLKADPDVGRELLEILRKGDSLSGDFPVMSPPNRSTNPIVNDNNFRRSSAFSSQMPALDYPRLETCKVSVAVAPKARIEGFFSPLKAAENHCSLLTRLA
ncbi:unnamed protein product [Closterium sp. Yama58-4]|nr:unnamed protein product [Closterium sp. Yama58-4]